MAVLTASYLSPQNGERIKLWDLALPANRALTIGRSQAAPADLPGPAEADREMFTGQETNIPEAYLNKIISWRHFSVIWEPNHSRLKVALRTQPRKPRNPLLSPENQIVDTLELRHDQEFRIGPFAFRLIDDHQEFKCHSIAMARRGDLDTDNSLIDGLIEVITRFQPGNISNEFHTRFLNGLRTAFPQAQKIAVAIVPPGQEPQLETSDPVAFTFSRTLITAAIEQNEVVESTRQHHMNGLMTFDREVDWAVCAPIRPSHINDPRRGVYLAGQGGAELLKLARRVAVLFAEIYRSLVDLRETNARYKALLQFLPKPVRPLVDEPDFEQRLSPVERNVAVLFCDLRGSCGLSDPEADLQCQWTMVIRQALERMSRSIVQQDGVVGGLIGDAVMAFWGWPNLQPDQCIRAVQAARSICDNFERDAREGHRVGQLGFGIGIAFGPAIVGTLGNFDMHKVDVFGPTVNLAARLESMTKTFGVRVLTDQTVTSQIMNATGISSRVLGQVIPAGFTQPIPVCEIFVDDEHRPNLMVLSDYQMARLAFEAGNWPEADRILQRIHSRVNDGPSQFMSRYIREHLPHFDKLRPEEQGCFKFSK